MSHPTPPRSFDPAQQSIRAKRNQRRARERLVLLSMFTTLALILLCAFILVIGLIADAVRSRLPAGFEPETNEESTTDEPAPGDLLYAQITKQRSAIHTGELILVNADHEYVFPNGTAHLVNIFDKRTKVNGANPYQVLFDTMLLQKDAFAAFERMMLRYYELSDDGSILITSAYRTLKEQEDLGSSVQAGYSDHHTGYCVALKYFDRTDLGEDHWIYENCHKYGFIVRYPNGKDAETGVSDYVHCFRYVGVAHATYIAKNGLCLEEYIDLLKNNYTSEHLAVTGADGNSYEVYYLPAGTGDITTLRIPSNYEYTVSGDNSGGFIVTVNLSAPLA